MKAISHKLTRKLFTLAVLLACLALLGAGREVGAADDQCCIDQHNTCTSQCGYVYDPATGQYVYDFACQSRCDDQYTDCTAPDGPGCGPAQPKTPCEECLDNCDSMQADCVASGTQTFQQCAYLAYRCRQRCNTYCIY